MAAIQGNKERGELILECMGRMGYAAFTPGEEEIAYGWDFIRDQAEKNHMKIVVANLYDRETGKRLAPAYTIEHVGDYSVGVFGLLGPELESHASEDVVLPEVRDPVEAARELVPTLREQCDVVVGLLHMEESNVRELLKVVPGIDLAIIGQDPRVRPRPEQVEGTLLVSGGTRAQRVAIIDLLPGETPGQVEFEADLVVLDQGIPDDPEMRQLVEATESEIKGRVSLDAARRVAEEELERGDERYLGDAVCHQCHTDVFEHWLGTAHAKAFDTLVADGTDGDLNCVRCHVTGFEHPLGFTDPNASPDLRGVQCEACHGPGSQHGVGYAEAAWNSCTSCHQGEWDKDGKFDAHKDWRSIGHPSLDGLTRRSGDKG